MASIWKHPKSRFWYAHFLRPDGTYTNRSTRMTSRREALRVALNYEDVGQKRMGEAQIRRTMSDLFQQVSGKALQTETIQAYFNRWVARKEVEAGKRTSEKYQNVVKGFLVWLGDKANRDLSHLTVAEIAAFRDGVANRVRAATVNVYIKVLRAALQQAWKEGLLLDNPAAKVDAIKQHDSFERRPFTLQELKTIIKIAKDEWRGIILIGLYTGARLTDITKLTWQNIDLEENEIRFVTAKTGRCQVLPLAKPLRRAIEKSGVSDDPKHPLFPKSRKLSASTLSQQFYDILESVGLAPKRDYEDKAKRKGKNVRRNFNEVSFHSLRHTSTSLLKNAGVIVRNIQRFP